MQVIPTVRVTLIVMMKEFLMMMQIEKIGKLIIMMRIFVLVIKIMIKLMKLMVVMIMMIQAVVTVKTVIIETHIILQLCF